MDVSIAAAMTLGLVSGFRHAFDPDHVVAVSTVLHERPTLAAAVRTGAAWGAGHTLTLVVAVTVVALLRVNVEADQVAMLELPVASMLVGLGVWAVVSSARRFVALRRDDVGWRDHVHGAHGSARFGGSRRGFAVGLVHGLAGSGALLLLAAATLPTTAMVLLYVLVFGVGSLLGMAAITAVLAIPMMAARRRPFVFNALTAVCGLASLLLGIDVAANVLGI